MANRAPRPLMYRALAGAADERSLCRMRQSDVKTWVGRILVLSFGYAFDFAFRRIRLPFRSRQPHTGSATPVQRSRDTGRKLPRNVQCFGAHQASLIGHSRAQKTWQDALDLQAASWQAVHF